MQAEKDFLSLFYYSSSKWTLLIDGSNKINGSGIGLVLVSPKRDLIQQSICCGFNVTNNEGRYKALIIKLSLNKEIGIQKVDIDSKSQLVVNQPQATNQARDSKMMAYIAHVKQLQSSFDEFTITQVTRLENGLANALDNLGCAL